MDVFVARQPVFNRNKEVEAYELLFRDSTENFMPANIDGDRATSSVLSESFMNMGLDSVSNGKKVFINFTENLILNLIPTIFPSNKTVIEVLEDVNPSDEVIYSLEKLKNAGFTIALDDFTFDERNAPLVEIADIIKVDFMNTDIAVIEREIKKFPKNISLLAEKVETWNEFRKAIDLGFSYFQGYFFSKPEVIKGKGFPALNVSIIELIDEINRENPDFDRIASIIEKDVAITFKLLSLMNSAFYKRSVEIKSVSEALVFLGEDEFRRFIAVVVMSNLSKNATRELSVMSCVRARFCELIAEKSGFNSKEAFVMGLFSLLDAILGQPMGKVLEVLPIATNIKNALIKKKGDLFKVIATATLFERGDFETCEKVNDLLPLEFDVMPKIYKNALEWSNVINA